MLTVADTAYSIAVVRAEEGALAPEARLFEDRYAALFAAAGAHAEEGTRRFLAMPFFREGIRLRTRFIDDAVREGLAAGLAQVVLLGAGFDARALRMPEIADRGVPVYEVDFAAQLEHKRAVLAGAGVSIPSTVAYVPCDFAAPAFDVELLAALEAQGFRAGAGALFVWEGVIGYIDGATIDRSLAFMARAGGPKSRVVLTFVDASVDTETAAVRALRAGFSACSDVGIDEVWRRHLPGEPPPALALTRVGVAIV